jgi:hypothetical protein
VHQSRAFGEPRALCHSEIVRQGLLSPRNSRKIKQLAPAKHWQVSPTFDLALSIYLTADKAGGFAQKLSLISLVQRTRQVAMMANLSFPTPDSVQDTEGVNELHRDSKEAHPVLSYASQLQRSVLPVEARFSYLEVCAGMISPDGMFPSNLDGFHASTFNHFPKMSSERPDLISEAQFVQTAISNRVSTHIHVGFFFAFSHLRSHCQCLPLLYYIPSFELI